MIMEEALKQYPKSTILLLCSGELHSQCGDMAKSIKQFHQAHSLDRYHPLPFINVSRTYQQLGELHTSKAHLEIALKCDPSLAMTRVDFAQLLRQLGQIEDAVVMINVAYSIAKHVSEIRDVLIAKYITTLQQILKEKGMLVM
jgi:tetratricopeptide (TPR) repeat protein